jgi:hypothetical protein
MYSVGTRILRDQQHYALQEAERSASGAPESGSVADAGGRRLHALVRRRVGHQAGSTGFSALMGRRAHDNRDQPHPTSDVLELFAYPFLD